MSPEWTQFAITRKASGDDSNLQVLGSDIRKIGDPARIRTSDLLLRRQLLYPAELRDHHKIKYFFTVSGSDLSP